MMKIGPSTNIISFPANPRFGQSSPQPAEQSVPAHNKPMRPALLVGVVAIVATNVFSALNVFVGKTPKEVLLGSPQQKQQAQVQERAQKADQAQEGTLSSVYTEGLVRQIDTLAKDFSASDLVAKMSAFPKMTAVDRHQTVALYKKADQHTSAKDLAVFYNEWADQVLSKYTDAESVTINKAVVSEYLDKWQGEQDKKAILLMLAMASLSTALGCFAHTLLLTPLSKPVSEN